MEFLIEEGTLGGFSSLVSEVLVLSFRHSTNETVIFYSVWCLSFVYFFFPLNIYFYLYFDPKAAFKLTLNSKPFSQLFRHPNLFPLFTTLFSSYEVIFAFLDYEQLWEHVRSTWSHLLDQGICKLWRFILKNFCQSYCRTNFSPSFTSWHFWTGSIEMAESAWYLCLN